MMRAIVAWSTRYRVLVLGLAGATMLVGFTQLPRMPRSTVPEFSPPYVEVQTEALGLSAEEVEQLITVPLEADLLQGVAFLDDIRSESVAGLSSIVLYFEPGTDIFRARQVVAERLTQAHALPNVSKAPQMLQPLSSASRVLMVSMSSKDVSLVDMSVLARWSVRPRLMGVPGVANVSVWGQRERQLQVLVDPRKLQEQRINLQHVIETTGNALWVSPLTYLDASTPGTGGFIDTPNQRLGVQHVFPIRTPDDLAQVPIAPEDTGGRIVRLGDVADVVEDHQPLIGDAVVNDGPGLLLVIEKFPNTDTLEVTRAIEDALAALKPALGGIDVDATVFRPATFIEEATANTSLGVVFGAVLLALVLFVFFRGWRSAVIALVSIVLSLTSAALVLYLAGATLNAIVVVGLVLAVGVLVDDGIVGIEGIVRRLRHPSADDEGRSSVAVAIEATLESRGAIAWATLAVVLAIAPLLFVTGVPGAFLPSLVAAYLAAIVASMLVALTVIPALAMLLLRDLPQVERETALVGRLRDAYARALTGVMRWSRPILAGAAIITVCTVVVAGVAGVASASRQGDQFLPSFKERDLLVHWDGAPGTSREEMNRIVARATAELRSVPGVRNVGAHVGRAVNSDEAVGTNAGDIWLSVDPAADYEQTLAAVAAVIDGYPGLRHAVATYTGDRIERLLGGSGEDVVVRVYGQDADVLAAKAEEVRAGLAGVAGLSDVAIAEQEKEPSLLIEVDLPAAERYGLKAGDVRRAAATLLSGIEVGFLFESQKVFEVVVWGQPELRQSLTSIRELLLRTPSGAYVTLDEVADVRIGSIPSVIRREGVFRYADVTGTVDGRDVDAVLADVRNRVDQIAFPLEHRAEIMGSAQARQADLRLLLILMAAALLGMLLVLQAAFASWRPAVLMLAGLPVALVGALVAAVATGTPFSIGVVAGFVGVLAIAARQAILMLARLRQVERTIGGPLPADVIVDVARERFAPVVTTALATAVTLVPLMALGGRPGLEIVAPMAIVVTAGLVTSTLVTLFVVPAGQMLAGPTPASDPAAQLVEQPGLSPA